MAPLPNYLLLRPDMLWQKRQKSTNKKPQKKSYGVRSKTHDPVVRVKSPSRFCRTILVDDAGYSHSSTLLSIMAFKLLLIAAVASSQGIPVLNFKDGTSECAIEKHGAELTLTGGCTLGATLTNAPDVSSAISALEQKIHDPICNITSTPTPTWFAVVPTRTRPTISASSTASPVVSGTEMRAQFAPLHPVASPVKS